MRLPTLRRPIVRRPMLLCSLVCLLANACDGFKPPTSAATSTPAAGSSANMPGASAGAGSDAGRTLARDAGAAATAAVLPRNPIAFATGSPHYVFVPNPRDRSVAVIDARSQQIRQAPCGKHPSLVAASQNADVALALDPAAESGCVVRADTARLQINQVALVPDANAIVFSADAGFAIAYHDDRFDAPDARIRAQAVSVIALSGDEPNALSIAVGLRPHDVIFAGEPLRARDERRRRLGDRARRRAGRSQRQHCATCIR
jgi:hypothetical protein